MLLANPRLAQRYGSADADTSEAYFEVSKTGFPTVTTADPSVTKASMPNSVATGVTLAFGETAYATIRFHNPATGFGQTTYARITKDSADDLDDIPDGIDHVRVTPREKTQIGKGEQNLLALDAGDVASSASSSWKVMTATLADADLDIGDVVSFSGELNRGAELDAIRLVLRFLDATSAVLATHTSASVSTSAYERLELANRTIPAGTVTIQVYAENPTLNGGTMKARRFMLNEGPVALTFKRPPLRKGRGTPEDLWPTKYVGEVPTHVRKPGAGVDVPGDDVIDKTNSDAADLSYDSPGSGVTLQSLKPAEAGAEKNPAGIKSASLAVTDDGSADNYSSSWTLTSSVTSTYTVRIRYYREGVLVETKEGIVATNLSDSHTEMGAGDATQNFHSAELQLLDGSGNAVGGLLEVTDISTA